MIFTLFYMYATVVQWWRLAALKNKLNGTLNPKNALLLCDEVVIYDSKKTRSFENLLFRSEERIGCTIVPKQKINLSQWLLFPKDYKYFPIYFKSKSIKIESPNIYILVQAVLETYVKHSANILQVENFGELIAWRASDTFEAILKTDIDKLTRLVHCYSRSTVDINHELKLLKIETVDVEGFPTRIKYDRKFSQESLLKYSYAPLHWKEFAECVKQIYSKIRDTKNPKITIENGKSDDVKKVPVSEVKPIKKDGKRTEDKNTLEVGSGDYRRHKKPESKTKEENKYKRIDEKHKIKEEIKNDNVKKESRDEPKKEKEPKTSEIKEKGKSSKDEKSQKPSKSEEKTSSKHAKKDETKEKQHKKDDKREASKQKKRAENAEESSDKTSKKPMTKRTTSSEKKLTKAAALCDEFEVDSKPCTTAESSNPAGSLPINKSNGDIVATQNGKASRKNWSARVKPPNILIYAESLLAKENVKSAFVSMLNKDKYTIYDLPTDSKHMMWNDSTVLVVVCGNVPPNLTFHLLQYLLTGGQLLCLCSDFLYSVLHTFTTAEVREHELVRFSYGQWKQVKMMHHIFCYQASPTKKQFSKDSDQSNQSSNGSSPVAPRTPSAVEIQHGGKDYVIQVQILGTEETWQTPSLLLATVKGSKGRAVFSQVHLEINPNEFEDDENKFEALKGSDQARMEILKDILVNHLEIDCKNGDEKIEYTHGFFLGRHDLKLKLFSECDSIKDRRMECKNVGVKFCGKDEEPESAPAANFMPIYIHSCPSNFSTVQYFESLATEHIGRLVIYSDVMASSHSLLDKTLSHGIVIIPRQQTRGVGRSNNVWISPVGSALFSLQLHIPIESPLGRALPLIQHLTMVAVVSAIKSNKGCQDLEIGIKWPNDLYVNKNVKVGGLLITSTIADNLAVVNIGCGVNLDNNNPTICINDFIKKSNETKGTSIKTFSYEGFFASVFNELERIFKIVQDGNIDYMFDLYYKYWLHNNTDVTVSISEGESENMKIIGIDEYGFLKVRSANGDLSTIHPDGNTFDMLKGLISRKLF